MRGAHAMLGSVRWRVPHWRWGGGMCCVSIGASGSVCHAARRVVEAAKELAACARCMCV